MAEEFPSSSQEDGSSFISRMRLCADRAGSVNALAKMSGLSQSTVRRYLEGGEPGRPHLVAIARSVGVDLTWLATGEGSPDGPVWLAGAGAGTAYVDDPAYASIERYDVRAAAGHGAVVPSERIAETLMFKRSWINQELNANPADLYLINVDGESMEPTLRPGDMILVDRRSAQSVPRDGIYVLRMDGSLLVKRLQRLPGRRVRVTSDNPAYEAFDLLLDDSVDDLAIIGRVVWAGRRM